MLHIQREDMEALGRMFSPVLAKDALVLGPHDRIGRFRCSTIKFTFAFRSLEAGNGTVQGAAGIAQQIQRLGRVPHQTQLTAPPRQ